jgi:hypothetical protein
LPWKHGISYSSSSFIFFFSFQFFDVIFLCSIIIIFDLTSWWSFNVIKLECRCILIFFCSVDLSFCVVLMLCMWVNICFHPVQFYILIFIFCWKRYEWSKRPTVLKRPVGVVIERQEVLTRALVVIEKEIVLFLLSELPILNICFQHKFKPVGRVRWRGGIISQEEFVYFI